MTSTYCSKPFAQPNIDDDKYDDCYNIRKTLEEEETALQQLKEKLDKTPLESKSSLVYAQQANVELVNDDHLLLFLYAEGFNVDHALVRLLRYWTKRHKLFGDKYTLPLTLYGAMSDHIESIKKGFLVLLPVLDEKGRAIIYGEPTLAEGEVDKIILVWWYLVHVAMENRSVRQNGFILITNVREVKLRQFDTSSRLAIARSDLDLPIRRQSMHIINPPIWKAVGSFLKAILSRRGRQSLVLHNGTHEQTLQSLATFSVPSHCIPRSMEGELEVCLEAFTKARLTIEDQEDENDTSSDDPNSSSDGDFTSSNGMDMMNIDTQAQFFRDDRNVDPQVFEQQTNNTQKRVSLSPEPSQLYNNTMIRKEPSKKKTHPGRHGDRRMNRAVEARQKDPNISLLSALLAGGFIFPQIYSPGVKLSKVKDTDGVTVYQRKNQLNRRLREERNRKAKS